MMIRTLVVSAAMWLTLCGVAWAEQAQFHTPSEAKEVVEAKDSAVKLRYDPSSWTIQMGTSPGGAKWRMSAIVKHVNPNILGMMVYRDDPATEAEVRKRAIAELAMIGDHDVTFSRRMVNGVSVLFMKGSATESSGDVVIVRSYYWMGPDGVVDYAILAPSEDFQLHRAAVMDLLNGLEIDEQRAAH